MNKTLLNKLKKIESKIADTSTTERVEIELVAARFRARKQIEYEYGDDPSMPKLIEAEITDPAYLAARKQIDEEFGV